MNRTHLPLDYIISNIVWPLDVVRQCWGWGGFIEKTGYGRQTWQGKRWRAHRLVWEMYQGPIPNSMVLDHLCENKSCVNPHHLQVTTNAYNWQRISSDRANCPSGHPRNTFGYLEGKSKTLRCRRCRQLRSGSVSTSEEGLRSLYDSL